VAISNSFLAFCLSMVISKIRVINLMTKTNSHKEQVGIVVAVAAIALGMFTVGNSYATGSLWGMGSAQISIDEATAIGIAHLQTESDNLVGIAMEKDDESFIYNLEFEIEDQEVSVEIDPHTGEILSVDEEPLGAESEDVNDIDGIDGETNDDVEANDGLSVSDGDGETNDDVEANDGLSVSDGDGETNDDQ
jgi:uncharacterized membrane protein YkoI